VKSPIEILVALLEAGTWRINRALKTVGKAWDTYQCSQQGHAWGGWYQLEDRESLKRYCSRCRAGMIGELPKTGTIVQADEVAS
jgi:hypothetical protein